MTNQFFQRFPPGLRAAACTHGLRAQPRTRVSAAKVQFYSQKLQPNRYGYLARLQVPARSKSEEELEHLCSLLIGFLDLVYIFFGNRLGQIVCPGIGGTFLEPLFGFGGFLVGIEKQPQMTLRQRVAIVGPRSQLASGGGGIVKARAILLQPLAGAESRSREITAFVVILDGYLVILDYSPPLSRNRFPV